MISPTYSEVKSILYETLKKLNLFYCPTSKVINAIENDLERIEEYERWHSKVFPFIEFDQERFTLNEKERLNLSEISLGILQINEPYEFYL
ncbi:MAG TPA: hypothetical protein V6C58_09005 [Allocoleopsis sp.]